MDQATEQSTDRKKPGPKPKAETVNIKIKSMGGKFISGGVNIVAGRAGKLKPGDVCEVPADIAKDAAKTDMVEVTPLDSNCRLVHGEIVRG
ncbi:hypothetical protein [Zhongshania sp.]|uniref:hypothetical protein n=1 Tax=Zhongshania sp. TaxID=1971902 RepID=UPI0035674229